MGVEPRLVRLHLVVSRRWAHMGSFMRRHEELAIGRSIWCSTRGTCGTVGHRRTAMLRTKTTSGRLLRHRRDTGNRLRRDAGAHGARGPQSPHAIESVGPPRWQRWSEVLGPSELNEQLALRDIPVTTSWPETASASSWPRACHAWSTDPAPGSAQRAGAVLSVIY